MCSSGLAGTKQHEFFDGMYAIRSTIPPRPACGERIEVRGRAQSETPRFNARSVCKVTNAYGIGKLTLSSPALSALGYLWVIGFLGRCPRLALNCAPLALSTYKRSSVDLSPTRMLTFPARA
jgi:hypothetical protein